MSIWTQAPEVRCGACGHRFDALNWHELGIDYGLECPSCARWLVLHEDEAIRRWTWRVDQAPRKDSEGT